MFYVIAWSLWICCMRFLQWRYISCIAYPTFNGYFPQATAWVIIRSGILVDYKYKITKYTTMKLMLIERTYSKVLLCMYIIPRLQRPLRARAYQAIFEVKTSLVALGRITIYGLASSWCYCARICNGRRVQEALIRFSKLGFAVAHGEFLRLQYEDYI